VNTSPYRSTQAAPAEAPSIAVRWITREAPLDARAVAAFGDVARTLARRLVQLDDHQLARITGVAGRDVIALAGASSSLPWIDGLHWLGRDVDAPSLLLPTALRPDIGVALFERCISLRKPLRAPLAVVPVGTGLRVVSLSEALPVLRVRLEEWVRRA
jgi:hypothetical protein